MKIIFGLFLQGVEWSASISQNKLELCVHNILYNPTLMASSNLVDCCESIISMGLSYGYKEDKVHEDIVCRMFMERSMEYL